MPEEEEEIPLPAKGLHLKVEQGWEKHRKSLGRFGERERGFFFGGWGCSWEMLRKLGKEDCEMFVVYYNVLR